MHKALHHDRLSSYTHHLSLLEKVEEPSISFLLFEELYPVLIVHTLEKIVRVQEFSVTKANFFIALP